MEYWKTIWRNSKADFPILIYSEIGDERYETRKVEFFRDGHSDYADEKMKTGNTDLGDQPTPPLKEIKQDENFKIEVITREEFERVWTEATKRK